MLSFFTLPPTVASLPSSHQTITGFAWRPDADNGLFDVVTGPATFRLSTTAAEELSLTFADNTGDDEALVFQGALVWQHGSSGETTQPFDFSVQFDQPFHYDPSLDGNLLLEFEVTSAWNHVSTWHLDAQIDDVGNVISIGGEAGASQADFAARGTWPTEFTFVPEPSSATPIVLGCLLLLSWRRAR